MILRWEGGVPNEVNGLFGVNLVKLIRRGGCSLDLLYMMWVTDRSLKIAFPGLFNIA